ncbi:ABC transporter ATP-binding protein [Lacisediminihabitans changchengi]|uniref:ABC transporter ATP-binding protein n=1 Tax=Lacisediminihabitans changchengi TaxID=2787634 RepID=UPI0027DD3CA6|nr:ABC transporter ATP-binding protein [Lacisediminihabitans changchengi]
MTKSLGGREIVSALDLDIAAGELICLLGPSGCGKTTTLRMIGGFLSPDSGVISISGTDHTRTPAERRPTAMVFQNYALWPHMTVFDNVAYGLKVRKTKKSDITRRVEEVLELVGLSHHLRSRPGQISGGEQQRVALARALVLEPSLLLLDEPLSNLDAKLRVRVREEIREIQKRSGITTVFVTHDQEEALSLADRIAVMNNGKIEQLGVPDEIYRNPATPFVARFVGTMNLVDAFVHGGDVQSIELPSGVHVPVTGGERLPGGMSLVAIRPEDVQLAAVGAGAPGTIVRDIPLGHYRELIVRVGDQELRVFDSALRRWASNDVFVTISRASTFASANQ